MKNELGQDEVFEGDINRPVTIAEVEAEAKILSAELAEAEAAFKAAQARLDEVTWRMSDVRKVRRSLAHYLGLQQKTEGEAQ